MKKRIFILLITTFLFVTYAVVINMKLLVAIGLLHSLFCGGDGDTIKPQKLKTSLCENVIGVYSADDKLSRNYVFDKEIYTLQCDTLSQVKFWRQIMNLSRDSALLSLSHNRTIVEKTHYKNWATKNDYEKQFYRDSVRCVYGQDSTCRILLTDGKKFFYDFDKAFDKFDKGITNFIANDVDPWYAQAILLIESPNKLQKSTAGAFGPFQLMKAVARLYGLKVNKQMDERADFDRASFAASSLIKSICIPNTKIILDSLHIPYNEKELWFKLLVMHSYHAGSGNVKKALYTFMPEKGDIGLIYKLWHAETNHFRSASQNYSQLVLAAMLEMNSRMGLAPETGLLSP